MARKSAAQTKPVKQPVMPKPDMDQVFEGIMAAIKITCEANTVTVRRADNMAALKQMADAFFYNWADLEEWQKNSEATIDEINKRVQGITKEYFEAEELEDLFADMIKPVSEVKGFRDLFWETVKFSMIAPYADKLMKSASMYRENLKALEAYKAAYPEE